MSVSTGEGRILVLTSTFPRHRGDTEPAFVFELCRHLAALGHRVTVLAPHAPGARRRETLDGVTVVRFRYAPERFERLAYAGGIMANLKRNPLLFALLPAFLLAQLVALARLLKRGSYDAVHAHWIVPQGLCLATLRGFAGQARTVCTVHGSDATALRGRFWVALRRWVATRCDRMVAVSEALRDQLLREGCPADRLAIIPMGTDLHGVFVPDASPRAETELLFVGRLVAGKGLDTLLYALAEIRQRHPAVRLTVVGAGPERARCEALARRLEVAGAVAFTGAVTHRELPAHYRRAALLVLPSRAEGFGLVAVEALGCGCPVAASDLPALREILLDGQAGALFRPDDPHDLAETVCRLLDDPSGRAALAETGRRSVRERFDWRQIAQRFAHVDLS